MTEDGGAFAYGQKHHGSISTDRYCTSHFPLFRDLFDDLRGGEGDSGER